MRILDHIRDFLNAPVELEKTKQNLAITTTRLNEVGTLAANLGIKLSDEAQGYQRLLKQYQSLVAQYNELQTAHNVTKAALEVAQEKDREIIDFDINKLKIEARERENDIFRLRQMNSNLSDELAQAQVQIGEKNIFISGLSTEISRLHNKEVNREKKAKATRNERKK